MCTIFRQCLECFESCSQGKKDQLNCWNDRQAGNVVIKWTPRSNTGIRNEMQISRHFFTNCFDQEKQTGLNVCNQQIVLVSIAMSCESSWPRIRTWQQWWWRLLSVVRPIRYTMLIRSIVKFKKFKLRARAQKHAVRLGAKMIRYDCAILVPPLIKQQKPINTFLFYLFFFCGLHGLKIFTTSNKFLIILLDLFDLIWFLYFLFLWTQLALG